MSDQIVLVTITVFALKDYDARIRVSSLEGTFRINIIIVKIRVLHLASSPEVPGLLDYRCTKSSAEMYAGYLHSCTMRASILDTGANKCVAVSVEEPLFVDNSVPLSYILHHDWDLVCSRSKTGNSILDKEVQTIAK